MKKYSITLLIVGGLMALGSAAMLFAIFMFILIPKFNLREIHIKTDPIYKPVPQVVETIVYQQETVVVPVHGKGKELVLFDKSGSMEKFVTELYKSNIEFFTKHDVWAFDTDVYKNIVLGEIEFGGNTDIFNAINEAIKDGYETIWLCSDLEHNSGDIYLLPEVSNIKIIIYSPKPFTEKSKDAIGELEKYDDIQCITIDK